MASRTDGPEAGGAGRAPRRSEPLDVASILEQFNATAQAAAADADREPADGEDVVIETEAADAVAPGADVRPPAEPEEVVPVDEAHDVPVEAPAEAPAGAFEAVQAQLDEMREDMLRAQAELVNFRNRVERDRQANREATIAEVLRALLPVLDDLDRAEAHGDLEEGTPMGLVAQKLRGGFERFGLTSFGDPGDPFDPKLHEAIFQQPDPEATSETVLDVVERGYRFESRVVRPAKVAVAVPAN